MPARRVAVAPIVDARGADTADNVAQSLGNPLGTATRTESVRALLQSANGGVLPEPATSATMIVGFAVIGVALRRKTVLCFV